MNNDLISREALLGQLADKMREHECYDTYTDGQYSGMDRTFSMIENAPAVDAVESKHGRCLDCIHQCYTEPTEEACNFFIDKNKYVEVVRCKDCKHFMSDICYFDMGLHFCRGDDFCSYGERKE